MSWRPDGAFANFIALPDLFCTNLCFGGPELRMAYATLWSIGRR
jgi:gluconolactonase